MSDGQKIEDIAWNKIFTFYSISRKNLNKLSVVDKVSQHKFYLILLKTLKFDIDFANICCYSNTKRRLNITQSDELFL